MLVQLTRNLFFSRALAVVATANYCTLVVCNLLQLAVAWTLAVYALGLLGGVYLLRQLPARPGTVEPDLHSKWVLCAALVVLVLPRLIYLSEWLPGNVVMLQFDDYARVAELVSMTLSEHYPLRHPSTEHWLLSFYYSSLYPMAALKLLLPVLTLKDCLLLGSLLYYVLILGTLLEIALRTIPSGNRWLFLFAGTLVGGFDWLALTKNPWFGHDEWWGFPHFGGFYQVSSTYTALFWTPHHYLGFLLPIVSVFLFRHTRSTRPTLKHGLLFLLLIAAAYTSPFAVLPFALVLLPFSTRILRRLWPNPWAWLAFASAFGPLFLFLNRVQEAGFSWVPMHMHWVAWAPLDILLSTLFYLLSLSLVDMLGLPLLACYLRPRMNSEQRWCLLAVSLFFVSTAFIRFEGFNNYCMRGMQLANFYYLWVVAKHIQLPEQRQSKMILASLLVVGSFGVFRDSAAHTRSLLLNSAAWYKVQSLEAPAHISSHYRELARNNTRKIYHPPEPLYFGLRKFNAEKFTETPIKAVDRWEREIARYPLAASN